MWLADQWRTLIECRTKYIQGIECERPRKRPYAFTTNRFAGKARTLSPPIDQRLAPPLDRPTYSARSAAHASYERAEARRSPLVTKDPLSTRRNPALEEAQDAMVAAATAFVAAATASSSAVQLVSSKISQVPSSNEERMRNSRNRWYLARAKFELLMQVPLSKAGRPLRAHTRVSSTVCESREHLRSDVCGSSNVALSVADASTSIESGAITAFARV